jgi:hypothetical protein
MTGARTASMPSRRVPLGLIALVLALLSPATAAAQTAVEAGRRAASPAASVMVSPYPGVMPIVSDDGRLSIYVPVGTGLAGVTLAAHLVSTVAPAVAAYQLTPIDQTFDRPVTVSWRLDAAAILPTTIGDLIWLAMSRSDDALTGFGSWLDDLHVTVVDGAYAVTGQLTRFGTLIVTELPTRIRGPEAIWGPGYAPGRGVDIPLDLTLATSGGTSRGAAFSGDWQFGGGYPDLIGVTTTVAEAVRLSAVWRCLRPGATTLSTTFGVREDTTDLGPMDSLLDLGPAVAAFSVTFPVACGTVHPMPNG